MDTQFIRKILNDLYKICNKYVRLEDGDIIRCDENGGVVVKQ